MSVFLIELSFGPVQSFINAARRSRDLWAGSYLLSEVARAAANSLLDSGAELIYPLADRVRQEVTSESSNLSNVLLARVPETTEAGAARIVAVAQEAARHWLGAQADLAWDVWTSSGVKLRKDIWRRQVDDAIDAYGAWSRVDDPGYRPAYDRLKSALAARKNTRDFAPMFLPEDEQLGRGIPKSSLDGLRESVLPKDRDMFPLKFGVGPGEQLDALGCIKRVLGLQERFTALTRVAADGWLSRLTPDELQRLCDAYAPLKALGLATGALGNEGIYKPFAFDASLLFPERLELALHGADDSASAALCTLKSVLDALRLANRGQPCPYAALVVADGDRMGRFIDKAKSAEEHARISRAVAAFADQVPEVARAHRGHCIFNGGEDLTVLFPLRGVVSGARALAEAFDACMKPIVEELLRSDEQARPSLRVGAAICHVLEPLGIIRGHGESAEKYAKGDAGTDAQGNALGLSLQIRGGHEIRARFRFDDPEGFAAFARWLDAYEKGGLPGGVAYEIRAAELRSRKLGLGDAVANIEFDRVLSRANQRGGDDTIDAGLRGELSARRETLSRDHDADNGSLPLADELILARWLSASTATDLNGAEGRP